MLRLGLREVVEEPERAGFPPVDCVYRFSDHVVLKAERRLGKAPVSPSS